MKFKNLTDDNFLLFAIKHYDNPQCKSIDEFHDDIGSIYYLSRLFKKYVKSGSIKAQLACNHIILIYNVFDNEAATRILFWKIEKEHHPILKTFLIYLQKIKENHSYSEWGLDMIPIPLDNNLVQILRGM